MAIWRNDFSLLLSIEGKCEPSLGGVLRVSGMTECELKSKPKKFLGPLKAKKFLDQKFPPPLPAPPKKIPCRISKPFKFPESIKWYDTIKLVVNFSQNYSARIRGHYHESSDFLTPPKVPSLKIEPGSEKPKWLFYLILFALQVDGEYLGENEASIFFLYFFVVYAGENSFLLVYWSSQYLPSRKLCAKKIA